MTNEVRICFTSLLLIFILFSGFSELFAQSSENTPNMVFIFSDDQRFDMIGALGNTEVQTPNLDRLVARGASFTHSFNMGAWNGAVCIASRAMMISGLSVWDAQQREERFQQYADEGRFWPQLLEKAGYDTYMTGKWHVNADPTSVFQTVVNDRPGMPNQTPEGYNRPKDETDTLWQPWDTRFEGFWKGGVHWSEVLATDALSFIERAEKRGNPFMMYLAFNAPHDPRQSPKSFVDKYPLQDISLPESYMDMYPLKDGIGLGPSLRDEALAPFPRTPYAIKKNIQEYYALITHMDEQIGKILDALEASGKADNTYIFFTSDHGLAVGHHGLMGKQNMYDHSVRTPLLISGPGIPKNKRYGQSVYLQDIMATILDLAGIEKPHGTVFNSLMPYIHEDRPSAYPAIYGCYMDLQRMVRTDHHKLIIYPKLSKIKLFDLVNDPNELQDQAQNPAYHQVKIDLIRQFEELQKTYNDTLDLSGLFQREYGQLHVDAGFPGGNVVVEKISGDTVYFSPDLRDTAGEWFYWNFRAISSKPQKWYFKATKPNLLTGLGAAYSSTGGKSWAWIDRGDHQDDNLFSFTFDGSDQAIRFSMGMPYTQEHLYRFLDSLGNSPYLKQSQLCVSEKGRPVEKLMVGNFDSLSQFKVLVTARAHACEMMGNYVMEGMISALLGGSSAMKDLIQKAEFMFVPFLDKDGVENGDQGKNRIPRDHNRDYSGESIYASTRTLREEVPQWVGDTPWLGIDLHNPWIKGEHNEWIYFVGNANGNVAKEQERFVDILEKTHRGPLRFTKDQGFLRFGTAWNTGGNYEQGASFGQWSSSYEGNGLLMTTTLEFPYALNYGQTVTAEGARAFGEDLVHALAVYLSQK